jgi:hypothetical protein
MTSAVGFTKPLVRRREKLSATRMASPMAEHVEIYKL